MKYVWWNYSWLSCRTSWLLLFCFLCLFGASKSTPDLSACFSCSLGENRYCLGFKYYRTGEQWLQHVIYLVSVRESYAFERNWFWYKHVDIVCVGFCTEGILIASPKIFKGFAVDIRCTISDRHRLVCIEGNVKSWSIAYYAYGIRRFLKMRTKRDVCGMRLGVWSN